MDTEHESESRLDTPVDTGKSSRLPPADEESKTQALKEGLLAGKSELPAVLDALIALPWSAGVTAVGECWPEMKATARNQFLSALGTLDSDTGKRVRLSVARGLSGQDARSAAKLIVGVCNSMEAAESGLSAKDRQTFAGVLFGNGKPWLLHLPLTHWKAADTGTVIRCALAASQQCPAFTLMWIVRWIAEAGKLSALSTEQIDTLAKCAKRWHPKLQRELRKAVPDLPQIIEEALAPSRGTEAQLKQVEAAPAAPAPTARAGRKVIREGAAPDTSAKSAAPPRGSFDLSRSLREIETYVGHLRAELQQALTAAKKRAPTGARMQAKAGSASDEDLESLRRHNTQLEETVDDLRRRLDELVSDHEDRAAAKDETNELQEFKTLLGLKLASDFYAFKALSSEAAAEVVRMHSGDLLSHVFDVLKSEGVSFADSA